MKRLLIFCAVLSLFCYFLHATDTPPSKNGGEVGVELKNAHKSVPLAILCSAAVPGAGHLYIGQNNKISPYLAADMLSVFALCKFNQEKNNAIHNYKSYANSMAGLRSNASKDLYYYASIYRSAEEYNLTMEAFYKKYLVIDYITQEEFYEYVERDRLGADDWWEWQYDSHFYKYRNIRSQKQEFEIYANFAIGAMIVNRIISVIDTALSTNRLNKENRHVYATPDVENKGFTLNYEFKF
ncbi:MAG: hypothetical protein FWG20_02950 [Candidatus Cloacimonetes bacterium]|nr:hypothetical protein [Candidatus Cloacimonadota bacterium]